MLKKGVERVAKIAEIIRPTSTLEVRPLRGEALGAEVIGFDFENAKTVEDVKELRKAFLQHQILVFRETQNVSPQSMVSFSKLFGPLQYHPMDQWLLEEAPEVVVISNAIGKDGKRLGIDGTDCSKDGRRYFWHSDFSYKEIPPIASMLKMVTFPKEGGDTKFANMYLAYESLDEATKELIASWRAIHTYANQRKWENGLPMGMSEKQARSIPEVNHPVVRTHPENLRKALYVSEGFTKCIYPKEEEETQAVLRQLFAHSTQPAFVYNHKWKEGDMVFWDNRCTIHLATGSNFPRTLYRTTIQGDLPF